MKKNKKDKKLEISWKLQLLHDLILLDHHIPYSDARQYCGKIKEIMMMIDNI